MELIIICLYEHPIWLPLEREFGVPFAWYINIGIQI